MGEWDFLNAAILNVVKSEDKIFLQVLGKRITELRTNQGLSKVQLAFEINTSESNIRRIEKGQINVGILTLKKLAASLNVTLVELIGFSSSSETDVWS